MFCAVTLHLFIHSQYTTASRNNWTRIPFCFASSASSLTQSKFTEKYDQTATTQCDSSNAFPIDTISYFSRRNVSIPEHTPTSFYGMLREAHATISTQGYNGFAHSPTFRIPATFKLCFLVENPPQQLFCRFVVRVALCQFSPECFGEH